ncbi:MAG: glycosyltransferase family 4 protein [Janthinobacterium lividum]
MPQRTIYLDVSELLARKLHTGIQRVVRQIARASMALNSEVSDEIVPVVTIGQYLYPLTIEGKRSLTEPPVRSFSAPTAGDSPVKRFVRDTLRLFPPLYKLLQERYVRGLLRGLYSAKRARTKAGDVYVILGSFWGGSTSAAAATTAARSACAVVPVIYDLIPISHPQFCDDQNVRSFVRDFGTLMPISSGMVTISKYSATEIKDYLVANGIVIPVRHFYLGANLESGSEGRVEDLGSWPDALHQPGVEIYTIVGTIEPRKGHAAVLDGFERLWADGSNDRLLIIGKVGWSMDAFMSRCEGHPELGRRLFLVHTATDGMVAEAYRFSRAAIIASSVEGFGLPLVEALYKGLPVIASDIPVFREIASDQVLYFKLDDGADLARAVREMAANGQAYRAGAAKFTWIDWQESARQFLAAVAEVSGGIPAARTHPVDGNGNAITGSDHATLR